MIKKNKNNDNDLSKSLKRNLHLRKKQSANREEINLFGKRTNKIGLSRLINTNNKK